MNTLTLKPRRALPKALLLSLTIAAVLSGCSHHKTEDNANQTPQSQVSKNDNAQTAQAEQADAAILVSKQQQSAAASQPGGQAHNGRQQEMALMSSVRSQKMQHAGAKMPMMPQPSYHDVMTPPQDNENYQQAKINPVKNTQQAPVSTFSVDVDTASYSNVRRLLNQGQWPQKGAVRVEEMINYFDYDYPAPQSTAQPFAVHTEVAASPWNSGTHLMRVALKGYQTSKENLPPMNLVFLMDVSGSMHNADKLPLLKRAFSLLTKQLRPQDHVSMVVYAGASGLVLKPTAGDQHSEILAALDKLSAGGSTNGGAGIELAYKTARSHFTQGGINRVILATDGDFNVGTTSIDKLKQLVEQQKDSGVFLSILGFGQGNYNDHLMEELSNLGNGTAYYVDSFKEARKVFSDGLSGTLQTIAKDVKIQVEFNPAHVSEYRLIGYDNRQLKREDFNNDKVDAGDIGAGHTVTAFYEVVLTGSNYHFSDPLRYQSSNALKSAKVPQGDDELAFVKLRYKKPDESKSQLIDLAIKADDIISDFNQASKEFQFATAVAAFGEKLRDSQYVDWSMDKIKQTASQNLGKDTWGYRHEFVQLTLNAQAIKK